MNKRLPLIVRLTVTLVWLAACAPGAVEPTAETGASANMPNPASVYCEQQGGRVEMHTDPDGTYGVCVFDDGSECEEWAYYRGECTPKRTSGDSVQVPDAAAARDAVLAYLRGSGVAVPAADARWTEQDLTEEELLGASHLRYTAGDWTVDVSFPIVAPQATIYTVGVSDSPGEFAWQGEVNAAGEVSELSDNPDAGLANPASVYCEEHGGRVEMRTGEGGTYGVCLFADGTECDEWAYWRGECGPAPSD
jgi:putative hemolysin